MKIARSILRNQLREKHGNKAMRKIWAEMQIRRFGKKAYIAMRYATDSKRRHSLADRMS